MLVAEIHGKAIAEVRDDEDYLTSAVFGHLRYVAAGPFWRRFFEYATTLPVDGAARSLPTLAAEQGRNVDAYDRLDVHFWPRHKRLGIPDLALCFSGGAQPPLAVVLEVKLWASKSGEGDYDQLARYLRIADDLANLDPRLPPDALAVVVYLAPRRTTDEIEESLRQYGDAPHHRKRLFQLRWQDVVEAIDRTLRAAALAPAERLALTDVARFLRKRSLERFNGMDPHPYDGELRAEDAVFYRAGGRFLGFRLVDRINEVEVVKGPWCHADRGR